MNTLRLIVPIFAVLFAVPSQIPDQHFDAARSVADRIMLTQTTAWYIRDSPHLACFVSEWQRYSLQGVPPSYVAALALVVLMGASVRLLDFALARGLSDVLITCAFFALGVLASTTLFGQWDLDSHVLPHGVSPLAVAPATAVVAVILNFIFVHRPGLVFLLGFYAPILMPAIPCVYHAETFRCERSPPCTVTNTWLGRFLAYACLIPGVDCHSPVDDALPLIFCALILVLLMPRRFQPIALGATAFFGVLGMFAPITGAIVTIFAATSFLALQYGLRLIGAPWPLAHVAAFATLTGQAQANWFSVLTPVTTQPTWRDHLFDSYQDTIERSARTMSDPSLAVYLAYSALLTIYHLRGRNYRAAVCQAVKDALLALYTGVTPHLLYACIALVIMQAPVRSHSPIRMVFVAIAGFLLAQTPAGALAVIRSLQVLPVVWYVRTAQRTTHAWFPISAACFLSTAAFANPTTLLVDPIIYAIEMIAAIVDINTIPYTHVVITPRLLDVCHMMVKSWEPKAMLCALLHYVSGTAEPYQHWAVDTVTYHPLALHFPRLDVTLRLYTDAEYAGAHVLSGFDESDRDVEISITEYERLTAPGGYTIYVYHVQALVPQAGSLCSTSVPAVVHRMLSRDQFHGRPVLPSPLAIVFQIAAQMFTVVAGALAFLTRACSRLALVLFVFYIYLVPAHAFRLDDPPKTVFGDAWQGLMGALSPYVLLLCALLALVVTHACRSPYLILGLLSNCLLSAGAALLVPSLFPWAPLATGFVVNLACHYCKWYTPFDFVRLIAVCATITLVQCLSYMAFTEPITTFLALAHLQDVLIAGTILVAALTMIGTLELWFSSLISPLEIVTRDQRTGKIVHRTTSTSLLGTLLFGGGLWISPNALHYCSAHLKSFSFKELVSIWDQSHVNSHAAAVRLFENAHVLGVLDALIQNINDSSDPSNLPAAVYSKGLKCRVPVSSIGVISSDTGPLGNCVPVATRKGNLFVTNNHVVVGHKVGARFHYTSAAQTQPLTLVLMSVDPASDFALLYAENPKECTARPFTVRSLRLGRTYIWAGVNPPLTDPRDLFLYPVSPGPLGSVLDIPPECGESGSVLIDPDTGALCGLKWSSAIGPDGKPANINYFLDLAPVAIAANPIEAVTANSIATPSEWQEWYTSFLGRASANISQLDSALQAKDITATQTALAQVRKTIALGKSQRTLLDAQRTLTKQENKQIEARNAARTQPLHERSNEITAQIQVTQARIDNFTDSHPEMVELKAKRDGLESELATVRKELDELVRAQFGNELKAIHRELGALGAQKSALRAEILAATEATEDTTELKQRVADITRQIDELLVAVEKAHLGALPCRMPAELKQIRFPIVYKDGDEWVTYLDSARVVRGQAHPSLDPMVLAVGKEYGHPKMRLWKKVLTLQTTSKEWALTLMGVTPCSLGNFIRRLFKQDAPVYDGHCPDCGKHFVCPDIGPGHQCDSSCHNNILGAVHRHMATCCSNHMITSDQVRIGSTTFSIGTDHAGHNKLYLGNTECRQNHECWLSGHEAQKARDADPKWKINHYHAIYHDGVAKIYALRSCVERLKAKAATPVSTAAVVPAADPLATILERISRLERAPRATANNAPVPNTRRGVSPGRNAHVSPNSRPTPLFTPKRSHPARCQCPICAGCLRWDPEIQALRHNSCTCLRCSNAWCVWCNTTGHLTSECTYQSNKVCNACDADMTGWLSGARNLSNSLCPNPNCRTHQNQTRCIACDLDHHALTCPAVMRRAMISKDRQIPHDGQHWADALTITPTGAVRTPSGTQNFPQARHRSETDTT